MVKGGRKMYDYTPPQIIHYPERPLNYDALCRRCGDVVHLRKQGTALLRAYADCAAGWRPAKKTISNKIGLPANKIAEIRSRLVDKGLIAYSPQQYIIVDWRRITAYAALDAPISVPDAKGEETPRQHRERLRRLFCASTNAHDTVQRVGEGLGQGRMDALTPEQRRIFRLVSKMTEREYYNWLGVDIGHIQNRPIIDGNEEPDMELREALCAEEMNKQEFGDLIKRHEKECPDEEPLPF